MSRQLAGVVMGFSFLSAFAPPLPGQTPELRLERALDVAADVAGISAGRILPDGGAVLADEHRLIRFDPAGRQLRVLGRAGSGPGEHKVIGDVSVMPDGEVVVADVGKGALVRWSASGTFLSELRVAPWMLALFAAGRNLVIKSHDWRTDSLRIYRFTAAEGIPARPSATFLAPLLPGGTGRVTTPIAEMLVTPEGRMLVAAADTLYQITELDDGGSILRQWRRDRYPVVRWTDEERDRIDSYAAGMRSESGGRVRPARETFKTRYTLSRNSIGGFDRSGRLWVLPARTGGESRPIDVFRGSGEFLGTINPAGNPDGIRVAGDRLLAWGTSPDGEPAAWMYRIIG